MKKKFNLFITLICFLFMFCLFTSCDKPKDNKTVYNLDKPVVTINNKTITWDNNENAFGYEIIVNDISYGIVNTNSYTLTEDEIGTYTLQVKAITKDSKAYKNSEFSDVVYITINKDLLKTPICHLKKKIVSWNIVSNDCTYEVYLNNVLVSTQESNSYTIEPTTYGSYSVKVKACPNQSIVDLYDKSAFSNEVTYNYSKPTVPTPIVEIDGFSASWYNSDRAKTYEVYLDGVYVTSTLDGSYCFNNLSEGTHKVQVKGISKDETLYDSSKISIAQSLIIKPKTDLSKDIIVYSKSLENRLGRYLLGIYSKDNIELNINKPDYVDRLNYVDNYLCNIVLFSETNDVAQYAWRLEEVTYNTNVSWVYNDYKIYRIRLTDGYYLSCSKNNLINSGGDYISETCFKENDIWQYWQFIPKEGYNNEYYIYNVGHGYDCAGWNGKNHFLVDTSRGDGGAELYYKEAYNESYFPFIVENIEGASFNEVKQDNYSGNYYVTNFKNNQIYGLNSNNTLVNLKLNLESSNASNIWFVEKVANNNTYLIKINNYYLSLVNYEIHGTTDISQACEFIIEEVNGLINGFRIYASLDTDFSKFNDTNDSIIRRYCYADVEFDGTVTRWWGSIDHRNDLGMYFIFTKVED